MDKLTAAKKHFITITEHRILVREYCFRMGLYRQGLLHDLSKYSPAEFMTGVLYFQGNKSPNAAERDEKGYSGAWLHHKGRNKHHYEYWTDISTKDRIGTVGVKMPLRYVAEMLADRIAACRVYQKDAYTERSAWNYYKINGDIITIHPETKLLLEKLLKMLAVRGEEETLRYMRWLVFVKKEYPADCLVSADNKER
jgi:hypothetical protein